MTTKKDLKDFFQVGFNVYKGNKYWISPFWSEFKRFFKYKDLFWRHGKVKLYIAYKENIPIGRIGAFIDNYFCEGTGKKIGFFGFFECINDKKIALKLLKLAQNWLKLHKIKKMQGPINGRADLGSGFVTKGFDTIPYLLGWYSHDYYNEFVKDFKMVKTKDLVSYKVDLSKPIPESVKQRAEECEKKGINIRKFNRIRFRKEMNWWLEMFMDVFSNHWGYTPVSFNEIRNRFGIKELRWIVDPKIFLVAEKDGKPIGFRWTFPDYNILFKEFNGKLGIIEILKVLFNRRKIDRGRFIIMGIDKKYQGMGIGTCMNYHNLVEMKKRGYKTAEYGWIDEMNIASIKAGEKIGGKFYKNYRVYEKEI